MGHGKNRDENRASHFSIQDQKVVMAINTVDNGTNNTMSDSKAKIIAYWIFTAATAVAMGGGGVADLMKSPDILATIGRLGYPEYFITLLGVGKVLGAVVILLPKFPRLKEWAYAGIAIDLVSGFVSHLAVGDPIGQAMPALVVLVISLVSYFLRPSSRRLPDPA